jgi:shikimate dehydrogenase
VISSFLDESGVTSLNTPARYAVIGNPVAHSQSPWIHAAFAQQTGQPVHYGRLLAPLDGFKGAVQAFFADATAEPPAHGCNVTVPFKWEAFALAARHTERASLAQAANTLRLDADGWLADNTDGAGLVRDIEGNAGLPLAGRRVLLIGSGGAAAGALGPLLRCHPAEVVVANRSLDKAQALCARHQALATAPGQLRATGLADCGERFDVVVNASASSLQGAGLPVAPAVFAQGGLALDMMYGPPAEAFLEVARAHGATPRDGLGMLVEQAAEAFALWRGVRPDTQPVLSQLRQHMGASAGLGLGSGGGR